ncbi:MAG: NAD-dependent epimerase/dehydratase family protein [Candidatus Omnitrophica bacterium]|nr:NAD-dependent epimerase/dehydratase family protein [Candidatus Omnitrophota bacterium]
MKVLITGGAGFIGSHIAELLISRSDRVLVLDNYATGRPDNLKLHNLLTISEGDIAERAFVEKAFLDFQPEIVIHAAASYKDPEDWKTDARTNVLGTINVLNASKQTGVRRLIYFQTSLCYGLRPLKQPITLDHPLYPESSYAISKTAAEQYIALSGIDFISFRLANIYGPRNLSGAVPTFYSRLTSRKRCFVMDTRRDYIFVQDLMDVVMKAIDGMGDKGYYHISSGSDYSTKDIFDAVVGALGIKLSEPVEVRPRNKDDVYTILLDPTRANDDFNWKTKTPLGEGIGHAVRWYGKHEIKETYTHLKG